MFMSTLKFEPQPLLSIIDVGLLKTVAKIKIKIIFFPS